MPSDVATPPASRTGIIIASHHANDPWRPLLAWPDRTMVQWGGHGIVLGGEEKARTTAFFEAFPEDGSAGFIRGEGASIEEAEASAHRQWSRHAACLNSGGHRWCRTQIGRNGKTQTWLNGGSSCRKCGAFQTMMQPVVQLGRFNEPLSIGELDSMATGLCREEAHSRQDESSQKWRRRMSLRAVYFKVGLPPVTPRPAGMHPFESDDYQKACRRAVGLYCRDNMEILTLESSGGGVVDFFNSMHLRSLKRLAEAADGEGDEG